MNISQQNMLRAGASVADITPDWPVHLSGYPFVERKSTGVHDRLLSSALFIDDGRASVLFIANDVIFVSKDLTARARLRISVETGVPGKNIMITATHTHSGPSTITFVSGSHDSLLPPVNDRFIKLLEDGIVKAATAAVANARPANINYTTADATGIGTNRHDPDGASDLTVPVLLIRDAENDGYIACMLIVNMHPTVLHEDSKLISGDFPGLARLQLQQQVFNKNIPIIYHAGPCANQSPRHVTSENTFEEAARIAGILSGAVARSLDQIEVLADSGIEVLQYFMELPRREMYEIRAASLFERTCADKLAALRQAKADPKQIRSAEVNWFGATESLNLAKLAAENKLEEAYERCMPAEIQIFRIGRLDFVAWAGEIFVEYGLKVKEQCPNACMISLANGDLQVYIVTEEALKAGVYESSNAIFDFTGGHQLVTKTVELLKR